MSKNLYYGEIVSEITAKLYADPDHRNQIELTMSANNVENETISTLCADCARVFDTIEELASDHFIDWYDACNTYAGKILSSLLEGRKPTLIDMVVMAGQSIRNYV